MCNLESPELVPYESFYKPTWERYLAYKDNGCEGDSTPPTDNDGTLACPAGWYTDLMELKLVCGDGDLKTCSSQCQGAVAKISSVVERFEFLEPKQAKACADEILELQEINSEFAKAMTLIPRFISTCSPCDSNTDAMYALKKVIAQYPMAPKCFDSAKTYDFSPRECCGIARDLHDVIEKYGEVCSIDSQTITQQKIDSLLERCDGESEEPEHPLFADVSAKFKKCAEVPPVCSPSTVPITERTKTLRLAIDIENLNTTFARQNKKMLASDIEANLLCDSISDCVEVDVETMEIFNNGTVTFDLKVENTELVEVQKQLGDEMEFVSLVQFDDARLSPDEVISGQVQGQEKDDETTEDVGVSSPATVAVAFMSFPIVAALAM